MGRALRSLSAVASTLALVATALVTCPCPAEAAAPPSGHECCAPPTGFRANDHGCCADAADAADLLVPGAVPAPAPADVAVVRLEPSARLDGAPLRAVVLAPSPPRAILRL